MKTILLAVSGSIAFYKAYELISLFKKENIKVKVLLSQGVLKFANKLSFEALADEILSEENESWENKKNHIDFSKDCDLVLFAPASINSINKLALGIADNLFIQTLIASNKPLIIAPAANTNMYNHFSTQNSLKLLQKNKALIIPPISKVLACKDEGIGALAEVEDIFNITKRELFKKNFWLNKSVVVSGGGTKEKIDDVRCIGNFSSGKMAKSIADAFYFLGAKVIFLSSVDFKTSYEIYKFESSKDLKILLDRFCESDFLIMAAAVSDFIPEFQKGKIKKNQFSNGFDLHLKLNEDLLKNVNFKGKKIGFKMEFDTKNAIENAKKSLVEKNLNLVCLNILNKKNTFGSDKNEIHFISKDACVKSDFKDKKDLAFDLINWCEKL
ncbi:bifunctional phosphopantothenoylcysteine decarboxylase/phosphopantothenate--cysteine ligase CoaBC [Campylobacter sp. 2018MI35]|uniref:bifunctional phosphopantothenoylcysteine decarboxylase/phosphopantothenate--cysteine ligase CoaBC n=1 Tax=Campylobacter molothri TaxID=1032242 RepID=UPI00190628EF|nr:MULTISPECIES: bifunctional phosphopantothenoylcysteine decarboxylase/phosphopantothenate--cysteine ligase CoaBC [unclassified Campylobacter]MBK2000829.1 bifunctional phosphopantothenoylcysteine decarboxylase/phosphopantothenate--cysteine ligase CoaBC [Campylobacter sp. 2018MI35]MBZ7949175.1 bifunctional phosphopantothenoylcysteine decarboxylase/phosphopantothenate--cysteine ligase CoaBC [Campylobacter sp. RM10534]ULN99778.1 phosphopantothenoylcysteine decarboxylase/phosphopantothenate--cystei